MLIFDLKMFHIPTKKSEYNIVNYNQTNAKNGAVL